MTAWKPLREGARVRVLNDVDEVKRLCDRPAPGTSKACGFVPNMAGFCGDIHTVKRSNEASKSYNIGDSSRYSFPFDALILTMDSAAEYKEASHSAQECKAAGYSAHECRAAGYSAHECRAAGYTDGIRSRDNDGLAPWVWLSTMEKPVCPTAGHAMITSDFLYGGCRGFLCNECRKSFPPGTRRWFCQRCSDDFCFSCRPNTATTTGDESDGSFQVTACGNKGKCVGRFTQRGTYKGRPLFANERGAIVYFCSMWKMNDTDGKGGWFYSVNSTDAMPPQDGSMWTSTAGATEKPIFKSAERDDESTRGPPPPAPPPAPDGARGPPSPASLVKEGSARGTSTTLRNDEGAEVNPGRAVTALHYCGRRLGRAAIPSSDGQVRENI